MKQSLTTQAMSHRFESSDIRMTDEEFDKWSSHTSIPNGVTEMRAAPVIDKVVKGEVA